MRRGNAVAGVLESNELHETERGTPQGSGISPLLANIFLHYVRNLWVHQWRQRHARGRVSVVRYADDFVMGFESKADAERMLVDLRNRLQQFGLTLHEDKTRLIEFGRLPAVKRAKLGAYYGMPHNWQALAGFRQQLRRIWFHCPRQRSQRSRRYPLPPVSADHSFPGRATHVPRVTTGKSRVRESRMLGSMRAKPNGLATRPRLSTSEERRCRSTGSRAGLRVSDLRPPQGTVR